MEFETNLDGHLYIATLACIAVTKHGLRFPNLWTGRIFQNKRQVGLSGKWSSDACSGTKPICCHPPSLAGAPHSASVSLERLLIQ